LGLLNASTEALSIGFTHSGGHSQNLSTYQNLSRSHEILTVKPRTGKMYMGEVNLKNFSEPGKAGDVLAQLFIASDPASNIAYAWIISSQDPDSIHAAGGVSALQAFTFFSVEDARAFTQNLQIAIKREELDYRFKPLTVTAETLTSHPEVLEILKTNDEMLTEFSRELSATINDNEKVKIRESMGSAFESIHELIESLHGLQEKIAQNPENSELLAQYNNDMSKLTDYLKSWSIMGNTSNAKNSAVGGHIFDSIDKALHSLAEASAAFDNISKPPAPSSNG